METDGSCFYVKTNYFIPKLRLKPPGTDSRAWLHCRYIDLHGRQRHPKRKQKVCTLQATKIQLNSRYIMNMHPGCAPEDLVILNLMGCKLTCTNNSHAFAMFRNVKCIQAEANKLTLGEFKKFPALKELNLSCNAIAHIPDVCDGWFTHLTKLDLAFNCISPQELHSLGDILCLEYLNLSHNSLRYLTADFGAPPNFPALRTLILENNELQNPITFLILSRLPRLEVLSLGENNISLIPCLLKHNARPFKTSDIESITEEKQFFHLYETMRTPRSEASDSDGDETCPKPPNTPASSVDLESSKVEPRPNNKDSDPISLPSTSMYKKHKELNAIIDVTNWKHLATTVIKMRNNNASKNHKDGTFKPTHINDISHSVRVTETEMPTLLRYCKDMAIFSVSHVPFPQLRELQMHKNNLTFGVDVMAVVTWPQLKVVDICKNPVTGQSQTLNLLKDFVSTSDIVLVANIKDRKRVDTLLSQKSSYCMSKTTYGGEPNVSTSKLNRSPSRPMFPFLSVSNKYYKEEVLGSTRPANLERLQTWEEKQSLARLERDTPPFLLPNAENINPKKHVQFLRKEKHREVTFSGTHITDTEDEIFTLKYDVDEPSLQVVYQNQTTSPRCNVCELYGQCMCPIEPYLPGECIYLQARRREEENNKQVRCNQSCLPSTSGEDLQVFTSVAPKILPTVHHEADMSRIPKGDTVKKLKSKKPDSCSFPAIHPHPDTKWISSQGCNLNVDTLGTTPDEVRSKQKHPEGSTSTQPGRSMPVKKGSVLNPENKSPLKEVFEERHPNSKSWASRGMRKTKAKEQDEVQFSNSFTNKVSHAQFFEEQSKKLVADKEYLKSLCGVNDELLVCCGTKQLRTALRREIQPHLQAKTTFKKTNFYGKCQKTQNKVNKVPVNVPLSNKTKSTPLEERDSLETPGTSTLTGTGLVDELLKPLGAKPKLRAPLAFQSPLRSDHKKLVRPQGTLMRQKRSTTNLSAMDHAIQRFFRFEPRKLNNDWKELRDLQAKKKEEEEVKRRQQDRNEMDLSANNEVFDRIVKHLNEKFPGIVINESTSPLLSCSGSSDDS